ncbi:MAG TPA: NAD(P)/FAD-dependent oxidoreductase, partial [Xanthomonadales bacterium]|nr:NAD(P)/FAD-dependent oxidoreductase [Xanthomonadales bacterium]
MKQKVAIIGSGMAGCFMALCLSKKGYRVEVYEERNDIRKEKAGSGRSFNITLYYRGIQALKTVGLWTEIKKISVLAKGNYAHYADNRIVYDPYDSHDTEVLYTVHRNKLNGKLLDIVEKLPNVKIFFNNRLTHVDKKNKKIYLQNTLSKKIHSLSTDLVVGADGVNSKVRSEISSKSGIPEQESWGYKEVHVTANKARQMNLQPHATHTWPRRNSLLIAFPNPDSSHTLMINLPLKGEGSFRTLKTEKAIRQYIANNFEELMPLLLEIVRSILNKPTGNFTTVRTTPWHYKDFIVLIGDAAHGVIPFYGQGVCAALDDCLIIDKLLDESGD